MRSLIWFLFLLNVKNHVYCVRFLGIFPFPSPSHYILGSGLMKGLFSRAEDYQARKRPETSQFQPTIRCGYCGAKVLPPISNLISTIGAKKYFKNIDNIDDILYNSSVVLLNSHPSTSQAIPQVPNMIEIGRFHVQPPKKLPADLQKFLDEATEGVIYFSLGSNLKSADLPVEKREAFLKTFGKLRQKVLWKWEEDVLPAQPPNVKLSKWFPQQDVLAHPNIKLFITQGGLLSTIETIYHGVPVLAIPVFADQKLKANNIVNSGFGLSLAYGEITEKGLTDNLKQLLSDAKCVKFFAIKISLEQPRNSLQSFEPRFRVLECLVTTLIKIKENKSTKETKKLLGDLRDLRNID